MQVHLSSQNRPAVKHSQYILRHFDFAHLQKMAFDDVFYFIKVSSGCNYKVFCFCKVFLPKPRVLRYFELFGELPLCALPLLEIFKMESYFLRIYFFSLLLVGLKQWNKKWWLTKFHKVLSTRYWNHTLFYQQACLIIIRFLMAGLCITNHLSLWCPHFEFSRCFQQDCIYHWYEGINDWGFYLDFGTCFPSSKFSFGP